MKKKTKITRLFAVVLVASSIAWTGWHPQPSTAQAVDAQPGDQVETQRLLPEVTAEQQPDTVSVCPSGCTYASIQQAINASASGAVLLIGAGTYNEAVTLRAGISLVGAGAAVTILRGPGSQPALTAADANIDRATLVEKMGITGGGGQNGAGVLVRNGASPTLRNLEIHGNSATSLGGGVAVLSGGDPLLDRVVIRNNAAPGGSGLALSGQSRATVSDSSFADNSATGSREAGAIYVLSSSQLTMQNSAVWGTSASFGGALAAAGGSTVQITGGRFENNNAVNYGGGLYATDSTLTVDGAVLINNNANHGGAISASRSTVSLRNSTFRGNRVQRSGGALLVGLNTQIVVDNCRFIDNSTTQWSGGAIISDQNPLEVRNSTFDGNRAMFGAAIHLHLSPDALLQGNTIINSQANDGAGVYVTGGRVRLIGNTLSHNAASGFGGALVIQNSTQAELNANRILYNSAGIDGGGIIFQSGATGSLTNNTISFNRAGSVGGGMTIYNQVAPTLRNNHFEGNRAIDGGAIQIEQNAAPLLEDNQFVGNVASRFGGAIVVNVLATPTLRSNTLARNQAGTSGGAMFINDRSRAIIDRNTIAGNTAGSGAGLVVYWDGNSQITGNHFNRNVASENGGAMFFANSAARVADNQITANQASGIGGGVLVLDGSPAFENNLINRNSAGDSGAGLYLGNSQSTLRHNTIADNGRNMNGDGVLIAANASPRLSYNVIVGNDYGIRSAGGQPSQTTRNSLFNNRLANYQGVAQGASDLLVDPRLVRGPYGTYYLAQTTSGQASNSPLVDACVETAQALGLHLLTTRTDGQVDQGLADIGFHFRYLPNRAYLPLIVMSG